MEPDGPDAPPPPPPDPPDPVGDDARSDALPDVLFDAPERGPEHPGLPSPWSFVLAFAGITLAGALGALIGYGIVNVDTHGTGGAALGLGALVGAVVGALGASVVAVCALRARALWRPRPIETALVVTPRAPRPGSASPPVHD